MIPSIVVVGSLNMDIVVSTDRFPRIGESLIGKDIHYVVGGKGANQALGCAKLGAKTTILGAVGDDVFGNEILQLLQLQSVDKGYVYKSNNPTGIATIIHTAEDNCIVSVPGANGLFTPEMLETHQDCIISADIMLVQLEIPLPTIERAIQIAHQHGVFIILNPAPAQKLPKALLKLVNCLTPNETELELITGKSFQTNIELEKILQDWESVYTNKVIVTRGEQGCSYLDNNKLYHVPSLKVNVVDTTGAGDCFNGSLAYGLTQKWSLNEAVSFAVKAASLSVTKFGASTGMPSLQEIWDFQ